MKNDVILMISAGEKVSNEAICSNLRIEESCQDALFKACRVVGDSLGVGDHMLLWQAGELAELLAPEMQEDILHEQESSCAIHSYALGG